MNNEKVISYIAAVQFSIDCALNKQTKLPAQVLALDGMSTDKVRIFLNTIVQTINAKYFEVGVWKGSTFVSAMYDNSPEYAVCLDNFSQFTPGNPGYDNSYGDPKAEFFNNLKMIKSPFEFCNSDAFSYDKSNFKKKFNVYFYDGKHDHEDQKLALSYYLDTLEDDFIFICDDWNFAQVKTGTREGYAQTGIRVHKEWELPANFNGDKENWWNGFYVAVCSKS